MSGPRTRSHFPNCEAQLMQSRFMIISYDNSSWRRKRSWHHGEPKSAWQPCPGRVQRTTLGLKFAVTYSGIETSVRVRCGTSFFFLYFVAQSPDAHQKLLRIRLGWQGIRLVCLSFIVIVFHLGCEYIAFAPSINARGGVSGNPRPPLWFMRVRQAKQN